MAGDESGYVLLYLFNKVNVSICMGPPDRGPRIQAKAWPFVKWTLELEQWTFCTFSLLMSSLKSLWFSDCPIRPGGSSNMHFSWLYTRIHRGSWWIWFGFYLVASVSLVTQQMSTISYELFILDLDLTRTRRTKHSCDWQVFICCLPLLLKPNLPVITTYPNSLLQECVWKRYVHRQA